MHKSASLLPGTSYEVLAIQTSDFKPCWRQIHPSSFPQASHSSQYKPQLPLPWPSRHSHCSWKKTLQHNNRDKSHLIQAINSSRHETHTFTANYTWSVNYSIPALQKAALQSHPVLARATYTARPSLRSKPRSFVVFPLSIRVEKEGIHPTSLSWGQLCLRRGQSWRAGRGQLLLLSFVCIWLHLNPAVVSNPCPHTHPDMSCYCLKQI